MFLSLIIKKLSLEDKEKIKEVYKAVSKLQIKALKIVTIYSEQKEVTFIRESFDEWQKIKSKVQAIVNNFDEDQNGKETPTESGYLG